MTAETTRVSSKGQIVIPRAVREQLELKEGELLSVHTDDDLIVLRRVRLPDPAEVERVLARGKRFAERKGITRDDVERALEELRRRGGKKARA